MPIELKNKILSLIDSQSVLPNNYESLFCDILINFLKGMFNDIEIKKQFTIENKTYDLIICNKVLIEFDEQHHKYENVNDNIKNDISLKHNYKLIRIKSNCNYGLEISKIYKIIKNLLY